MRNLIRHNTRALRGPGLAAKHRMAAGHILDNRYRLDHVIGEGSMGVVWAGVQLTTLRPVAVKLTRPATHRLGLPERADAEARALASIDHPHVVQLLDAGRFGDAGSYLVLERLHGETLLDHLARHHTLSLPEASALLRPVASALLAVEKAGLTHADIKPGNIFLCTPRFGIRVTKLIDFGLAVGPRSPPVVIGPGEVAGTLHYMAPEQLRGETVGPWTDVWSFAVVLYRALSGRLPFTGKTAAALATDILHGHRASLTSLRPDLDTDTCVLLERALERCPRKRLRSASELLDVLTLSGAEILPGFGPARADAGATLPSSSIGTDLDTLAMPVQRATRTTAVVDTPVVPTRDGVRPNRWWTRWFEVDLEATRRTRAA